MEFDPRTFDCEFDLAELLAGMPLARMAQILMTLLDGEFRLVTVGGRLMLGRAEPFAQTHRITIRHDLEPIGHLESASADEARLSVAAGMVELMLQLSARYLMATDSHSETLHEDYALPKESEARYKALPDELEARVRQQVETIETAQRQLYQAEKLAAIGRLAACVAHEINNPLGFIRSNLSTAQQYVARLGRLEPVMETGDMAQFKSAWKEADMGFVMEDFATLLRESIDGADRVAKIVADLKGFSSVDQAEADIVDLNDNLRFASKVLAGQIKGKAELVLELGALPKTLCLPGHLNQVFLNLLLNAEQAIADRGRITVQSDVVGDEIRIRISDNGSGIPAGNLSCIFDPFFTTREVGSGSGLGLTVCRDIVQAHGGRIEVESKVGVGTTFTVVLPIG